MADRPFDVIDCEQRSEAWFAARAGILTGTAATDMLAKIKTGEAAARRDLRTRLVVERLTGLPAEDNVFLSAEMKRGLELEAEARMAYEVATGNLVDTVGFIRHKTLPIGCSPDGIVGDWEGGLELKVPKSATHLSYLRNGNRIPSTYLPQVTHALYVTGLPFWDFASYDPRFPESARLYIVRLYAKDAGLEEYSKTLAAFLAEVEQEQADVARLVAQRAEAA